MTLVMCSILKCNRFEICIIRVNPSQENKIDKSSLLLIEKKLYIVPFFITPAYPYRTRRSQKRNKSFYLSIDGSGYEGGKSNPIEKHLDINLDRQCTIRLLDMIRLYVKRNTLPYAKLMFLSINQKQSIRLFIFCFIQKGTILGQIPPFNDQLLLLGPHIPEGMCMQLQATFSTKIP